MTDCQIHPAMDARWFNGATAQPDWISIALLPIANHLRRSASEGEILQDDFWTA